ncbi:MAG: hypothetical protein HYY93_00500 [Planctomycetes bacterium]|nr:hypothetical protein [Planctomycetota bacterium]
MTPRARRFALMAHVVFSVGWLGAVAAFLALAVAGLLAQDPRQAGAHYVATETITWWVIVPLAFASLLSGLLMARGTEWGLFRHSWVVAKFVFTLAATLLLLLHTRPIGIVASRAVESSLSSDDLRGLRIQLVADAAAALLVLILNTGLSAYKPKGLTPFGRRLMPTQDPGRDLGAPGWARAAAVVGVILALLFIAKHLAGGGFHHP